MVSSAAVDVAPDQLASGVDYYHPALLPRIPLGAALEVSSSNRTPSPTDRGEPQPHVALETGQPVAAAARICEHWKRYLEVLNEVLCHQRRAVADGKQTDASGLDCSMMLRKASDLLAAE